MTPTEPNGKDRAPVPQGGFIQMVIQINPANDSCQVMGPLDNKGLCYQFLELARDTIKKYSDDKKNSSLMKLPPGMILPPPPGGTV